MDKLSEKSYRQYDYISRYQAFPLYYNSQDEKYIYGTTAQLSQESPYVLHTVKVGDTLDLLALKYYQQPMLYWVICDFNKIQDPYIELQVGEQIKIPTLSTVSFDI